MPLLLSVTLIINSQQQQQQQKGQPQRQKKSKSNNSNSDSNANAQRSKANASPQPKHEKKGSQQLPDTRVNVYARKEVQIIAQSRQHDAITSTQ